MTPTTQPSNRPHHRNTPLYARLMIPAILAIGGACMPLLSNTRVRGDRASIEQLVGQWEGTYSSAETGRSGIITFVLRAGTDTAQGDVIMSPHVDNAQQADRGVEAGRSPQPISQVLTIRFVRAAGNDVLGVLDSYPDPVCGCSLETRFRGRLSGDEIKGEFETRSSEIFHRASGGVWAVRRILRVNTSAAKP